MKFLKIAFLLSLFFFQTACNDDDSPDNSNEEFIKIEFTTGPHDGFIFDGTAGPSVTESLSSIDEYSSNFLLAVDPSNADIIELTIEHENSEPGTYPLGNESNPISSEGNRIKLATLENANTSRATTQEGELTITEYDKYYTGSFEGIFKDEDGENHGIKGSFRIEL